MRPRKNDFPNPSCGRRTKSGGFGVMEELVEAEKKKEKVIWWKAQ
jgi:hypothetical protein